MNILILKYESNNSDTYTHRQRRLCNILKVPLSTWSFFQFKKKYIVQHLGPYDPTKYHFCENIAGLKNLSFEEKVFIYHRNSILRWEKEFLCVYYTPSSLKSMCLKKFSSKPPKIYDGILPKTVIEEISNLSQSMPLYSSNMFYQFKSTTLNDHFMKIDKIFSKDFVVWFQNEYFISNMMDVSSIIVLRTTFKKGLGYFEKRYEICSHCLKFYLESNKISGLFRRYYFDVTYKFEHEFELINYIRNPLNWCCECKRSPLFYFIDDKYMHEIKLFKIEHYI